MQLEFFSKPVIGMIHLPPLPGSHCFDGDMHKIEKKAMDDARALKRGGVDAVIIENACDNPFLIGDEVDFATIASMSVLTKQVAEYIEMPIGISCATNAVRADIAIAKSAGASFIRSTGWVNGYFSAGGFVAPAAAAALRYRAAIKGHDIQIMADIKVKNGSHLFVSDKTLSEQCSDAKSAGADYIILTGCTSGVAPDFDEIKLVKETINQPVLVGSGATTENVAKYLSFADGVIIGSYFKERSKMEDPIVEEKVSLFMKEVNRFRACLK